VCALRVNSAARRLFFFFFSLEIFCNSGSDFPHLGSHKILLTVGKVELFFDSFFMVTTEKHGFLFHGECIVVAAG
jgi:hypothetical protein